MNQITALLLAALIGAAAGVAAGAFAALASLRASQVSARAPLAAKIHSLNQTVVQLRVAVGTGNYAKRLSSFNVAWNDLAVHQKILVPSNRISGLNDLVLAAATNKAIPPDVFVKIAGDALNTVAEMISAHSKHLFRSRAEWAEQECMERWLTSPAGQILNQDLRGKLSYLARHGSFPAV